MATVICLGVQWGDEGKGKIVDYLTEKATLVVRFQGGSNAGHTLVVDGRKTALRLIPSGILRKTSRCLLAAGVVVDPEVLLTEMDSLQQIGVEVTPERLGIASEAHLVLPYHQAIDAEREKFLGASKIGTTGKGIGPAYEDAVARFGIRFADLNCEKQLKTLLERNVELKNKTLRYVFNSDVQFNTEELFQSLLKYKEKLTPFLTNVSTEVDRAHKSGKLIIFEGAQGSMLDVVHGTYPYVTSSSTLSGFACVSAGFAPSQVNYVLGVCKAYATRVGTGPFPTEDLTPVGDRLREIGREFGTVTGRPRRCGHYDAVVARRTCRLSGVNGLLVTKLDVLTGLDRVRIAVEYKLNGKIIEDLPCSADMLGSVEVRYEDLPGWKEDIGGITKFSDLPKAAADVLTRISENSGAEVVGFSVGPEREQTVITSDNFKRALGI